MNMTFPSQAGPAEAPPGFEHYFAYPASLFQLSNPQHIGLPVLGSVACLSVATTGLVVAILTYRMFKELLSRRTDLVTNELHVLIYNLLLADFFQAFSFLFSFHWYLKDKILAPSSPCWTQAWFLHIGDVASGAFVLAIALHTYWRVFWRFGNKFTYAAFVVTIFGLWGFSALLASLAPIVRGSDAFVRAGSWCWINGKYETDRLWLHYLWIFIYEFSIIIIYAGIGVKLHMHAREMRAMNIDRNIRARLERSQIFMACYPTIYVLCTLPLAIGRMYSMAHGKPLPDTYMIVAGCLIASCGWMDATMYTLTRNIFKTREAEEAIREPNESRLADTMVSAARPSNNSPPTLDASRMASFGPAPFGDAFAFGSNGMQGRTGNGNYEGSFAPTFTATVSGGPNNATHHENVERSHDVWMQEHFANRNQDAMDYGAKDPASRRQSTITLQAPEAFLHSGSTTPRTPVESGERRLSIASIFTTHRRGQRPSSSQFHENENIEMVTPPNPDRSPSNARTFQLPLQGSRRRSLENLTTPSSISPISSFRARFTPLSGDATIFDDGPYDQIRVHTEVTVTNTDRPLVRSASNTGSVFDGARPSE